MSLCCPLTLDVAVTPIEHERDDAADGGAFFGRRHFQPMSQRDVATDRNYDIDLA